MVKRRCTYAFETFYRVLSPVSKLSPHMFNEMTVEEKVAIMSLNFDVVHNRIYGASPSRESLQRRKNMFNANYLGAANAAKLQAMICASTRSSSGIWEIPKGRMNSGETPLAAAMREFTEETSISDTMYKVDSSHVFTHSFMDCGVRYDYMYYLGFLDPTYANYDLSYALTITAKCKSPEVVDMAWMSIDMINAMINKNIPCSSKLDKLSLLIITTGKKIERNRKKMIKRIIQASLKARAAASITAVPVLL